MSQASFQRLLISRADLKQTRLVADPDAPEAPGNPDTRALADGEARLAIAHFALTANNITYAAFGDAMKYWQFFPTGDAQWGCIPVWGFAEVCESRAAGVEVGQRVYGYLPMGTHLVVRPGRAGPAGFMDQSPHRAELAAVYNHLSWCATDPAYRANQEGQQAVLRPLFTTSFLIDDFLAEHDFFGARQLLLSSASSKTAYGTAFCLSRRRGQPGAPQVIGLTSPANLEFTRGLGCYDKVLAYDAVATGDASVPSVFIDFAGNADLRRQVHTHHGGALAYSCSVGGTHWDALGGGAGLPGPRPTLFFAPAQVKKRSAPPPEGWGVAGLQQRINEAWGAFMVPVNDAAAPWLRITKLRGAAAAEAAYQRLLAGSSDPREGLMLSM